MIYCPTPSSLTNNWRDICLECERNSENIGQAPDEEPLLFCFVRFVGPFSVFGGGGGSGVEGGGAKINQSRFVFGSGEEEDGVRCCSRRLTDFLLMKYGYKNELMVLRAFG